MFCICLQRLTFGRCVMLTVLIIMEENRGGICIFGVVNLKTK
jgi:hypothetical protein